MFNVYIHSGNSIILTALFLLHALNYERYGETLSLTLSPLLGILNLVLFVFDLGNTERFYLFKSWCICMMRVLSDVSRLLTIRRELCSCHCNSTISRGTFACQFFTIVSKKLLMMPRKVFLTTFVVMKTYWSGRWWLQTM